MMKKFKVELTIPKIGKKEFVIERSYIDNEELLDMAIEIAEEYEFNYVGYAIGREADALREDFYKGVFSSVRAEEYKEE